MEPFSFTFPSGYLGLGTFCLSWFSSCPWGEGHWHMIFWDTEHLLNSSSSFLARLHQHELAKNIMTQKDCTERGITTKRETLFCAAHVLTQSWMSFQKYRKRNISITYIIHLQPLNGTSQNIYFTYINFLHTYTGRPPCFSPVNFRVPGQFFTVSGDPHT